MQSDNQNSKLTDETVCSDYESNKKHLKLILIRVKRKDLTDRKITELRNRFEETFKFMKELQFASGIEELKKLKQQFFSR